MKHGDTKQAQQSAAGEPPTMAPLSEDEMQQRRMRLTHEDELLAVYGVEICPDDQHHLFVVRGKSGSTAIIL